MSALARITQAYKGTCEYGEWDEAIYDEFRKNKVPM